MVGRGWWMGKNDLLSAGASCSAGVGGEIVSSGRDLRYFPTQNVEKMISNTSSTYVAPVI